MDPNFNLHNGVSRMLVHMRNKDGKITKNKNVNPDIYISDDISYLESRKNISVILHSNMNGDIKASTLKLMLERAKTLFPDHKYTVIGHHDNSLESYKPILRQFSVEDGRTEDRTCKVVLEQIKNSSLVMGPHTGLMYPALGYGCQVWCEESKTLSHNFCLDFPSNRPLYIRT
jgi:hypothetical protein